MNYCDFGMVLRTLRKERSMTQSQLGSQLGLSKAVLSKYELGLGYPSYDILIRMSHFFGVTTDYLLGLPESKTIDVSGLTENQISILHHLIAEFHRKNQI